MTQPFRRTISIARRIETMSSGATLLVAAALETVIVLLDVQTGSEISFSIFYVLPISMLAWRFGRGAGLVGSALSALAWYVADRLGGPASAEGLIPYWNALVRLVFFAIITQLLVALHILVDQQSADARIDVLTGLLNRRGFGERAELELIRARRSSCPITIAYFDIDGFKQLNDTKGHAAGDLALVAVSRVTLQSVRELDVVGRIGGDEFVVLLPETSAADAHLIIDRLHVGLKAVGQPIGIGFSVGVVTFDAAPIDLDAAVHETDLVMFEAKHQAKGTARYAHR